MNIEEYISSGIVESYVLGLATPEERAEFEKMCAAHSEVRKAREAFELSLEETLVANAVQPSKNLKSKVFAEIDIEKQRLANLEPPVVPENGEKEETPVVRMDWRRYLVAASLILLIVSAALNLYLYNRYRDYSSRYSALVAQQTELARNYETLRTKNEMAENSMALMRDPAMAVIKMPATNVATTPDSTSMATVFWHSKSKDVYLMVNHLPNPAPDKQYQLWAIVDGQPVDAGVFNMEDGMLRMKNIPRAEMFAITLEQKGGSPTPKGPMYVAGKTS